MSSFESTEDTNSLSMNKPVGTVMDFLRREMLTIADSAMLHNASRGQTWRLSKIGRKVKRLVTELSSSVASVL